MRASLQRVEAQPAAPGVTDPVTSFLGSHQSEATRRAYTADLKAFFGEAADAASITGFLRLPRTRLARRLRAYKAELLAQDLSVATVNRRLAVLRSFLRWANQQGLASCNGSGLVESERVERAREPELIGGTAMSRVLAAPGTVTLRGWRDTALLYLLGENALRPAELFALNVGDFSLSERQLCLAGGRVGLGGAGVPLSQPAAEAIAAYLVLAGHAGNPDAPLFRNLDHRPGVRGARLLADAIYSIVREHGCAAGMESLTPHQLRRSAIMIALESSSDPMKRVLHALQSPEGLTRALRDRYPAEERREPAARSARERIASREPRGRWRRVIHLSRRGETVYSVTRS